MSEKENKFNLKFTFLLSFAIFSQEIMWNFYDSQVPVSLSNYITSVALIGFVMGIDNLLGLFIEPFIGNVSDNTRTRFGRRMPFIIVGMPLSAIFFILIPFETSLVMLLIIVLGYVSITLLVKAPAESLMPDFIVPKHRSKANAIVKMMAAISIVFAALISALIVDVSLQVSFLIPAIIMVVALIILVFTVREKNAYVYKKILLEEEGATGEKTKTQKENVSFIVTLKDILKEDDKSTLFMLLAILMLSISWSALRALLTLYGMDVLGLTRGNAGSLTLYGGIAFIIVAYPLSVLAEKVGRLLFVKIGFLLFTITLFIGFLIPSLIVAIIVTILTSVAYAMIAINAIVIVWGLSPSDKATGTYTGLYYLFFYAAAAFGPALVGLLIDLTDMSFLFLNAAIFTIVGFIFMFFVKREHSERSEEEIKNKID